MTSRGPTGLVARMALVAVLGAACGPKQVVDTDGETETSGGGSGASDSTTRESTSADPEPELPAECVCSHGNCGALLCSKVVRSLWCQEPDEIKSLVALQCALTALRDRTPGVIEWEQAESCGYSSVSATVSIAPDATAIVAEEGWADCSAWTGPVTFGSLREPEFFAACLAEPDPVQGFACLRDALAWTKRTCAPQEDKPPPCGP